MAINKVDWPNASTPSYTPDIETDYNDTLENLESSVKGHNTVSLTEWSAGSTLAPSVSAGSEIESNGVVYRAGALEPISTTGASSGTVYLVIDESGLEYVWTSSAPSHSATKCGWYVGDDRYCGYSCYWDGASSFTAKINEPSVTQERSIGVNDIWLTERDGVDSFLDMTAAGDYYFPRGYIQLTSIYILVTGPAVCDLRINGDVTGGASSIELKDFGTVSGVGVQELFEMGGIISNGDNYFIRVTSVTGTVRVRYMRYS